MAFDIQQLPIRNSCTENNPEEPESTRLHTYSTEVQAHSNPDTVANEPAEPTPERQSARESSPPPTNQHAQPNASDIIDNQNETVHEVAPPSQKSTPSKALAASRWSRLACDGWSWELAGIGLSIVSFFTICALLAVFDGRSVPSLPHGITVRLSSPVSAAV
jgi:hypothetical protein